MAEADRNVLLIDNSITVTGASRVLNTYLRALQERLDFYILTPNPSLFHSTTKKAYTFKFLELSRSLSTLYYPIVLMYNTIRAYRIKGKIGAKVIHVNDCYNMVGVMLKVFSPTTYLIYHVRLLPDSYIKPIYPYLMAVIIRFSDKILCNSQVTFNCLPDTPKKVLIPDAISLDTAKIRKAKLPAKRLLYIANYIEGKGHSLAIECMKEIVKTNRDYQLLFVGAKGKDNNYLSVLKALVKEYNLEKSIIFEGFQEDVASLIRDSQVVLNFSRSESFSMVCLESMWYGTAIISLNSGGPSEFIVSGENGILLDKDSTANECASAVLDLLSDPKRKSELESNARQYVRRHYSVKNLSEKLERVYLHGM